jgi:hypothetical protein
MNICKKCNSEIQGNYCPNCGHPQKLERINGRYILSEIGSVLNFQKGILYTIKELLIRPGQNVRAFISEDRNRLVKPIVFILITSLLYSIFVSIFHFNDVYVDYNFVDLQGSSSGVIFQWITENYGYSNIIMAVFIAMWIKVLFRKYNYNFYEILILLCFIMGMGMLMFALFGAIESLTKFHFFNYAVYIFFIYIIWAIGHFFDKRKIACYLKALISYLLGMITFTFISIGLGILIDLTK